MPKATATISTNIWQKKNLLSKYYIIEMIIVTDYSCLNETSKWCMCCHKLLVIANSVN